VILSKCTILTKKKKMQRNIIAGNPVIHGKMFIKKHRKQPKNNRRNYFYPKFQENIKQ